MNVSIISIITFIVIDLTGMMLNIFSRQLHFFYYSYARAKILEVTAKELIFKEHNQVLNL